MQITMTFNPQEVQEILNGLSERPYKSVAGLIPRIMSESNMQIAEQSRPAAEPERMPTPPPPQDLPLETPASEAGVFGTGVDPAAAEAPQPEAPVA